MESTEGLSAKNDAYYNFDKARIAAVIPGGSHAVVDVGCAAGGDGDRRSK
jgi:hypothetical protein